MKILVVGVIPPPVGGVSIHVKRLLDYCGEFSGDLSVAVFDYKKKEVILNKKPLSFISAVKFFFSSKVVHVHISNNLKILIIFISRILSKKIIYTHHNSLIKNKFLFKFICWLSDDVILVNADKIVEAIPELYQDSKIKEIPAFIPPIHFDHLSDEVLSVFDKKKVISTNCSSNSMLNGEEVYGISRLINVFEKGSINNCLFDCVLFICDPSGSYGDKFLESNYKLLENGNCIFYWNKKIDFSSVVKRSTLTVRATITDGDSLSVRESLYFNVPVIASDCVKRPQGTVIYQTTDDKDLLDKIVKVLSGAIGDSASKKNYANDVLDIYQKYCF